MQGIRFTAIIHMKIILCFHIVLCIRIIHSSYNLRSNASHETDSIFSTDPRTDLFAPSPVLRQTFLVPDYAYVDLGITPPTHSYRLTTWKINYKHKMALVFHKRLKASRSVLSSPSLVRQLAIGEMIRKGEVEWFLIFSGSNSNRDYDMIVIGGGSGGLACSKEGIYTIVVIFVWYLCLYQIKLCQAYVFL